MIIMIKLIKRTNIIVPFMFYLLIFKIKVHAIYTLRVAVTMVHQLVKLSRAKRDTLI